MASLSSPKSSRGERSYDHGVLNLIDYEVTNCLEWCFVCNLCFFWNLLLVLFGAIVCFLVNYVQLLPSFNKIIPLLCFHHPFNKQLDLILMNFNVSLFLYSQNHL